MGSNTHYGVPFFLNRHNPENFYIRFKLVMRSGSRKLCPQPKPQREFATLLDSAREKAADGSRGLPFESGEWSDERDLRQAGTRHPALSSRPTFAKDARRQPSSRIPFITRPLQPCRQRQAIACWVSLMVQDLEPVVTFCPSVICPPPAFTTCSPPSSPEDSPTMAPSR